MNVDIDARMNRSQQAHGGGFRLAGTESPYLLQHATNPVEWWPWGPEAFAAARQRDVPVFLSIGYATCHWCHVMARESFEDAQCAAEMNASFVCIKVDREQRPDVDDIYMNACQIYTQATEGRASGGWPLSAFLEPTHGRPFFVGTYFPPQPAWERPSFTQLLTSITASWSTRRPALIDQSSRMAEAVTAALAADHPAGKISPTIASRAALQLTQMYDRDHGGFGSVPKFPQPSYFSLLLAVGGAQGKDIVAASLTKMACGGVFDQVAGGFHRYSVDQAWMVPHFEKMLYDNALLAPLYAQISAENNDPFLRQICQRILAFVDRELAVPHGGFYCALDADVEHREGAGHVWTPARARGVLAEAGISTAAQDALMAATHLDRPANFRDPHHPDDPPSWVLQMRAPADALDASNIAALEVLHRNRMAWPQPLRDDKVLLGWNGLMIDGFATAGRVLKHDGWKARAEEAALWIFANLRTEDGWMRCWRSGRASIPATLEDIASMGNACMSLWRNSKDAVWLERAHELYTLARGEFFDDSRGWWSDVRAGDSLLFVRPRSANDGAVPSGTALILRLLVTLVEADAVSDALAGWRQDLATTLEALSVNLIDQPLSMSDTLTLLPRAQSIVPAVFASASAVAQRSDQADRDHIDGMRVSWKNGFVEVTVDPGAEVVAHDGSARGLLVRRADDGAADLQVDYPTASANHDGAAYLTGSFRIRVRPKTIDGLGAAKILIRASICRNGVCAAPQVVLIDAHFSKDQ